MTLSENPYLFELKRIGSASVGYISIAENDDLPFDVKRVFWTYYTPNEVIRGNHAHKNLSQIVIAVSGQVIVETEARTGKKDIFHLDKPNEGLFLPSLCWRTLQFSHSAVLLCLASANFEENEYIRDYESFKKIINGKG